MGAAVAVPRYVVTLARGDSSCYACGLRFEVGWALGADAALMAILSAGGGARGARAS